jgi:hypothetical protein
VERFLKSYGLIIDLSVPEPSEAAADDLDSPRFIDGVVSGNSSGGKFIQKSKLLMFADELDE